MRQGVDYEHSFSPVPHASSFRTMLSIATANNMHIEHIDISHALVQANLIEGDKVMPNGGAISEVKATGHGVSVKCGK
jgi:hypothetical protein